MCSLTGAACWMCVCCQIGMPADPGASVDASCRFASCSLHNNLDLCCVPQIGETICSVEAPVALPTIQVEEPTVSMTFKVGPPHKYACTLCGPVLCLNHNKPLSQDTQAWRLCITACPVVVHVHSRIVWRHCGNLAGYALTHNVFWHAVFPAGEHVSLCWQGGQVRHQQEHQGQARQVGVMVDAGCQVAAALS